MNAQLTFCSNYLWCYKWKGKQDKISIIEVNQTENIDKFQVISMSNLPAVVVITAARYEIEGKMRNKKRLPGQN